MVGVAVGVVISIDLSVGVGCAAISVGASDGPPIAGAPVKTDVAVASARSRVRPGVTLAGPVANSSTAPHADTAAASASRVTAIARRAHPPHSGFQIIRSHPYRLLSTRLPAKTTSHGLAVIIAQEATLL